MCRNISFHCEIDLTVEVFPELDNQKQYEFDLESRIYLNSSTFPLCDVVFRQDDHVTLSEMEWGVVPTYEKDPKMQKKRRLDMVNAKVERALEKGSYWSRLLKNPVLIPATHIYEHRHIVGWKNAVPYAIRTNHQPKFQPFFLPGIYQIDQHVDEDGVITSRGSWAMFTCPANEVMRNIHNGGNNPHRMPLYLPLDMAKAWISPTRTTGDVTDILNYRLPDDALSYHTVYTLGGKTSRPDGKAKDEYWEWPNLPPLGTDTPLGTVNQTSLF